MATQLVFYRTGTPSQLLRDLLIAHPIDTLLRNGIVEQLISSLPFHQANVLTALEKAFAATSTFISLNSHFQSLASTIP